MISNCFVARRTLTSVLGGLLVVSLSALSAQAWGPHETITQAAINALGTNDALVLHLDSQTQRLTNYAWMGDYFGVVVEDPKELFYADDYLLFPEVPNYLDHTGPEVRQAFRPFFRRAVQALRTENSTNAARWIGALIHFVQDAGCPPHAAGLRGDVHSKMEAWVEADQIRIPNYQPNSLGATDDEVLRELLRRLDRIMPQAEEKGRRLRVPVEIGNRSAVREPMLESALECARLTADLFQALGRLSKTPVPNLAVLRGKISSQPVAGMERFPAKVVLAGTSFSTLADLSGRFEFRNLPTGNYTVLAFRPGSSTARSEVKLTSGETSVCDLVLPRENGNLVLNSDFRMAWVRAAAPDYWYQAKSGWEGEPILLRNGERYRVVADFKPGATNMVIVRWTRSYEHAVPRFKIEPRFQSQVLTAANREMVLTGSSDCGLAHITIRGRTPPASVCDSIRLEAMQR